MKKLLTTLLALLLALGLAIGTALPVIALEEDDWLPVITLQPQSCAVYIGGTGSFTLRVEAHIPNGDALGYQWRRYDRAWWVDIEGATGPELTIEEADSKADDRYRCTVYNLTEGKSYSSVTSDLAKITQKLLTEEETPVFTLHPADSSMGINARSTLQAAAHCPNGDPVGYHWIYVIDKPNAEGYFGQQKSAEFAWVFSESDTEKTQIYCVAYNLTKGIGAGSVTSEIADITFRLPTAREMYDTYKYYYDNRPTIREGYQNDSMYLWNGLMANLSYVATFSSYWVLDLFGVSPERLDSASTVTNVFLIPLFPVLVVVLVPWGFISLFGSLILNPIYGT